MAVNKSMPKRIRIPASMAAAIDLGMQRRRFWNHPVTPQMVRSSERKIKAEMDGCRARRERRGTSKDAQGEDQGVTRGGRKYSDKPRKEAHRERRRAQSEEERA